MIADSLVNDLAELPRKLIVVLDDVHVIHEAEIYHLLAALLRHPLQGLHLILLTRQDPPLALGHLRAYGQMTELRTRDLRFSAEETASSGAMLWLPAFPLKRLSCSPSGQKAGQPVCDWRH
ncbi:MAG: hypothetical protein IPK16_29135 [Anaerolineales bacterium]|nr:hypothetical protein [Anaerolineales bacterium]